jgi:hypothetical protein
MDGLLGRLLRFAGTALAAAIGWFIGFMVSFTPAQSILADPARQSAKFLAIFFSIPPAPRIASPPQFLGLVLVLGVFLALAHRLSRPDRARPWWHRGLRFGALAWLFMVPWFELYLPWNVLHEPMPLVLLEAACWWITLTCSGLAIAAADSIGNRMEDKGLPRAA